jgi:signal peptidase I
MVPMNEENAPVEALNKPQNPQKWWKTSIAKDVAIFIGIFVFIVIPIRIYIAEPYVVDGRSMDPTFATGDYLIIDKISYKFQLPKRNSVVVLNATNANEPNKSFIKRIIGLPGETVVVKGDEVKIINSENTNGFTIDQSYITHSGKINYQKTLAGDEYFVMGDNRLESYDSRYWGALNKKYITGKPVLRLFGVKLAFGYIPVPVFTKFGILPGQDNN